MKKIKLFNVRKGAGGGATGAAQTHSKDSVRDSTCDSASDSEQATQELLLLLSGFCLDGNPILELIAGGADVNAKTQDNVTPLHYVLRYCSSDIVLSLLAQKIQKIDVDVEENLYKDRPLHIAAERKDEKVMQGMLAKKPILDARNRLGETALHIAILKHNCIAAVMLMQAGANLWIKDTKGRTPIDIANENGFFFKVPKRDFVPKLRKLVNREICKVSSELRTLNERAQESPAAGSAAGDEGVYSDGVLR